MKQNLETKVGIFLLLGIAVICTLILFFGELGDFFKPMYSLTVKFPNASGLLKGSDVYLSGALIGKVTTDPHPIPDTQKVEVKLKIDKDVGIRQDADYVIGSSGLLGDKFVEVRPKEYKDGDTKADFVKDGEVIEGQPEYGVEGMMKSAEPLIDRANHIAAQLDDMITRLNTDVLSGTSTDELKETIAKLRDMVNNGDDMVKNANDFLLQAKNSKGTLGLLMNDKETRNNIRDLIQNMKEHGPVFYKDDAGNKDGKKK